MRTTQAQVESFVDSMNTRLKERNSEGFLSVGYSYGRTQIELVTAEQLENIGKGIQRTLYSGTKNECWEYLHALQDMLVYFLPTAKEQ
jgi:hypothetical protein